MGCDPGGRRLRIPAGTLPWILTSLQVCILSWGEDSSDNFTPWLIIKCWSYFKERGKSIICFIFKHVYKIRCLSQTLNLLLFLLPYAEIEILLPNPLMLPSDSCVPLLHRRVCLRLVHHCHFCQCRPGGDGKPDASFPVRLPTKLHSVRLPVNHAVHHRAPRLHRQPLGCHVSTEILPI